MDQGRWHHVKALFQAAIEQSPADRDAFLQRQSSDESLCAEVMRLLRLHDESSESSGSSGFLRTPIEPSESAAWRGIDPFIGRRLDGFLILGRIGSGGMGVVYEAQQDQPRRRAAIKVLRPGFATPQALRRFEYESEILAKLQHPGIAHVYAAGTFDLGDGAQPWFAMELIEGRPLGDFVKSHPLSVKEKLELLLLICEAVQHAHQRGVVHRDLKPANILVPDKASSRRSAAAEHQGIKASSKASLLDASMPGCLDASPKILDFGVARVIDADAQATMHTAVGEFVGTLTYMSPEQFAGDPNQIDARCDVYALGVIGYELLAGRLPYDRKSSAMAEVIRSIEWEEPRRLGLVNPSLRGDLETIFAKALEKDRARRYQSAAELAADIRRHLNHEPVLARPATALYQLRKFARRNRTLVGGVVATIIALAAGLVLYAREAQQARMEATRSKYETDKATAINNFITNDFLMKLLAAANAGDASQRLPVAELVDQAAENIAAMFADQPLSEAAVRNEVATIYYNLGAFDKAAEQFRMALEGWESQLGPDHADTLKAVNNLGQTLANLRRPDEAEVLYRRALEGRLRVLGEDDPFTLVSMNNLASLLRHTGRLDEAEPMLRRTLQAQRRVHGPTHKNTLITMVNLGSLLLDRGNTAEGLALHRDVYEASRTTLGEDHAMTLAAGSRLGQTLHRAGELEAARSLLLTVLAGFERTFGPGHNSTISTHRALARTYRSLGNPQEAAAHLRLALDGARSLPEQSDKLIREIEAELQSITQPPLTNGASP